MVLRKYFILVLALIGCQSPFAQETEKGDGIPMFRQVTHPFMPPITSEYFFFSKDGLLWFSSSSGLTSFDGSELQYHSTQQEATRLGMNRIGAMVEDEQHNFYIGTQVGLFYFDRAAKKIIELPYVFTDDKKKKNIGIACLLRDEMGVIYAGAGFYGLFIYHPESKKMSHFNLDPAKPDSWGPASGRLNTIISILPDRKEKDKLWVGTSNGIYGYSKSSHSFSRKFEMINPVNYYTLSPATGADTSMHPLYYDICRMDMPNDSTIWFNCWGHGFGKYDMRTGRASMVMQSTKLKTDERNITQTITRFAPVSPGKYLLGIYDDKTAIFDTRTGNIQYFNVSGNTEKIEQTRFVTNDHEGNVWLLQRGMIFASIPGRLRLKNFTIPNLSKIPWLDPLLKGIYYDAGTSSYYLSCKNSTGIHVLDTLFQTSKIIPTPLVNNYFNYNSTFNVRVAKDGSGRFWSVGWDCYVKGPSDKEFRFFESSIPALSWMKTRNNYDDVVSTRDGNILLRKNNGLIYQIDHKNLSIDTISVPAMKNHGIQIKNASAWYDSVRGLVYLTQSGGIAQYDISTKKTRIIPITELYGQLMLEQGEAAPTLDQKGRIWLMIPKFGIRIMDPISLRCIDSIPYGTSGLNRADYTAIIGGSGSYVVLRSRNGITVYDYNRKHSFLFDQSNGLSSPDNQSFQVVNGHLVLSQSDRVEYYRLADLDSSQGAVHAYLTQVTADTNRYFLQPAQEITLPHTLNTLSFSFSAIDFIFPERIEYAYQLVSVDNDWNYTNYFNRKIIYSKLSPGNYSFRLKAQYEGGNWDVPFTEYQITIRPAWWQTTLFKLLCILAGAVLIIAIVQWRIKQIRERERQMTKHEKELLELEAKALRAQMNPHFIFNSLNSIKSLINKNENEKATGYLTTFSKLIRTLFQNSDRREISLYEELETCRLYTELEGMRFGDNIQFAFEIDPAIDLKDVKIPALVLQPFIENAIWHGLVHKESKGKLLVSVRATNGSIECVIDDNGIGRELSKQYKKNYETTYQSKGIGLTQSRLELDKILNDRDDSIEIIDKNDLDGRSTGTKVIITFNEGPS